MAQIYQNKTSDGRIVNRLVVAEETNVAAGNNYYPSSAGQLLNEATMLSFSFACSGDVSLTVEATNDPVGTVSPSWTQITGGFYRAEDNTRGAESFVNAETIIQYENLNVERWRVKCVTSDGTNSIHVVARWR